MIDIAHKIRLEIHHETQAIADTARAEQRQHQVGPGTRAPAAKGLPKVFVVFGQIEIRGHIQHTQQTKTGIENKPRQILYPVGHLSLQQVICADPDIFQIREKITHAGTQQFRQ